MLEKAIIATKYNKEIEYYINNFLSVCTIITFLHFWYTRVPKPRYYVPGIRSHCSRRIWLPSHEAFGSGCYCLPCTEHNNNDDVDQEKVKEWTQGDFVNVRVRRGCRLGQPVPGSALEA